MGRLRGLSLFWRIFLSNALLLVAAALVLIASPATVSSPPGPKEIGVIAAGVLLMLVLDLFLVKRQVAPLETLAEMMRRVDPLRPGQRVRLPDSTPEAEELAEVFNRMLARLEDERRESGRRMLAAQESERRRAARELHDQVGQALTGLMLTMGRAAKRAPEVRGELTEAQEATRQLSADVNDLVRRLRPEALDDLGLTSALTVLGAQFSEASSIDLTRDFGPALPALDSDVEVVLYRVAQESLTNVARHASAASVELRLTGGEDRVVLEIADDGRGLDGARQGSGIRGMRERAMLVGGSLEIESRTPGGVTVRLEVPAGEAA